MANKKRLCNECKQPLRAGERMRNHWQNEHAEKYAKIRSWLGESDEKIRMADMLAKEGMKGPGGRGSAPSGLPPRQSDSMLLLAEPSTAQADEMEKFFEELLAKEGLSA